MQSKRGARAPLPTCAPAGETSSYRLFSTFGELEAAPRLGLAVLLALDHARIAGQESAALERTAQVRLIGHQRLRQAVAHCAGLARKPAARDRAHHVILAGAVGRQQRLLD